MPNTLSLVKTCLFYILIAYVFVFLLISPECAKSECKSAIELCLSTVVPVLFPFMVISDFVITTGIADKVSYASGRVFAKVFNTSKISQIAFFCGTLFGFPLGAKTTVSLYENGYIEKDEAERLLCFCSNTGPGFVIGIAGGCLHDSTIGLVIYISQLLSAMTIGLFLRKREPSISIASGVQYSGNKQYTPPFLCLTKSVSGSVMPTLNVCAFVCFFSVIKSSVNEILDYFGSSAYSSAFVTGFLEITNGLSCLSSLQVSMVTIFLASFFVGFSGLSVCMQTMSLTSKTDLKTGRFFICKLIQGLLCAFFAVIICKYLKLY